MALKYPPLLQLVVSMAISYGCAFLLPGLKYNHSVAILLAVIFGIAGLFILISAVRLFAKAKTTVNPIHAEKASALVTDGFYNYTRNPMYLGMLFCLLGVVIWLQNPAAIIGIAVFVITMTVFQIKPEEDIMSAKFGQEYEDYKARVRRWM